MRIDLYGDWITLLKGELVSFGYDAYRFQTPESIVHAHLNLIRRLVRPMPRSILKAKNFSCPQEHLRGLAEVERKVTAGENLKPHLSKLLHEPSFNDPLLNDWSIHHLHLGTALGKDGFVDRTGPVLFARFDESAGYFIDVLSHGSWTMQRLVKSLHDNWPDSIQKFRLSGATGLATPISDNDVKVLRKKNANTMIDLGDGIVYLPIGGGYASSGLSSAVVMQADWYRRRLEQIQQEIINQIDLISEDAKQKGLVFSDSPQFVLEAEGDDLYAVEVNCMIAVKISPL